MRTRSLLAIALVTVATPHARLAAQASGAAHAPPAGRIDSLSIPGSLFGADRAVWVYTPPGYDSSRAEYPLLLAFDGSSYTRGGDLDIPSALDSLLAAGHAPAFVAVMIDDGPGPVRIAELGNSARFTSVLATEIIPWIRARYRVTRDPRRTIITGSSAGGLAAANAALAHPELFGNVLSQSGAFWRGNEGSNGAPYEWLTAQVARAPKRDVRFLLDVGSRETIRVLGGSGPVFIEANRRFRDALTKKGYDVVYTEVPDGVHAPDTWRPRFATDLVALTASWRTP
jgi:enterochelin esterase family protein